MNENTEAGRNQEDGSQGSTVDKIESTETEKSDDGWHPLSQVISEMDIVVASGGGYMCDSDKTTAFAVLERLNQAIKHNVATVMVGQGMGPIQNQEFREKAKEVLPKVDLILAREKSIAPPLLKSLGVDSERIMITGDDAIELAYDARSTVLGDGIGVNLRIAHYTEVGAGHINSIKPVLHNSAEKYNARLISLPISHSHKFETVDSWAIQKLLEGYGNVRSARFRYAAPFEIVRRVTQCRLVVSGSFHPAVFALAQGIPVVCIANSEEYIGKFSTLAEMFGTGCEIIHLDDALFEKKLAKGIENAWDSAERVRPALLEASIRQIEMGQTAYRRIYELATYQDNWRMKQDNEMINSAIG